MNSSSRSLYVPNPRSAGQSAALVFIVTLLLTTLAGSASAAQFKWRVETSAPYSQVRPAVGPDGSVYAVDVFDNLIAVAPDGTELWRVANAGSKGVDVGPDGTIYTGNEEWIRAFYPDGSLKWEFQQDPRAFVLIDVAVGPDGNIYAVASSGMGVLSLADGGPDSPILRWQTPEAYTRTFVGYTEIEFGLSASRSCIQQLYFYANSHTRSVCLEDGSEIFSVGGGNTRPRVSPVDSTWHRGDSAYSPDGVLQWQTDFPLFDSYSEPTLASDGTHYTVVGGDVLYALDLLGTIQWTANLNEFVGLPDVDPTKSLVIMPTSIASSPLALKAVSAENGSPQWRLEFPADDSGLPQHISSGIAYSPNGATAYVMTFVNGANKTYLNAVDTGLDPGAPAPNPPPPAPAPPPPDPVDPAPDPVDPTPDPVDPTPDPVNPTPDPVDPIPDPVDPIPDPVDPTPPPADPIPDSVDPTPPPADPIPDPVEPAPDPVDPVPTPVVTIPAPTGGTDPGSSTTNTDPVSTDTGSGIADSNPSAAQAELTSTFAGSGVAGTGSFDGVMLSFLAGVLGLLRLFEFNRGARVRREDFDRR